LLILSCIENIQNFAFLSLTYFPFIDIRIFCVWMFRSAISMKMKVTRKNLWLQTFQSGREKSLLTLNVSGNEVGISGKIKDSDCGQTH